MKCDMVTGLQDMLVVCCMSFCMSCMAHYGACWALNVNLLDLYDSSEGGREER